ERPIVPAILPGFVYGEEAGQHLAPKWERGIELAVREHVIHFLIMRPRIHVASVIKNLEASVVEHRHVFAFALPVVWRRGNDAAGVRDKLYRRYLAAFPRFPFIGIAWSIGVPKP